MLPFASPFCSSELIHRSYRPRMHLSVHSEHKEVIDLFFILFFQTKSIPEV